MTALLTYSQWVTAESSVANGACNGFSMTALGHVWTAPLQELSDVCAELVGCGHVSGLLMRPMWPLALMLCADRVPIHHTHSSMR